MCSTPASIALDHFNTFGWHEGRDPNALFDTSGYLAVNQDVAAAGVNPLDHYHQSGWQEGRDPSADFDTTLYLIHNPDVAAAGIDPLQHYLQFGIGRRPRRPIRRSATTSSAASTRKYYLLHNPDVAAAGVDPLQHYNTSGWHEGRNPNAWFDTAGYLSHYADVAAAGVNPLQHYETFGWNEGRDPSAGFDTLGLSRGQSGCRRGPRQPARPLPEVRHLRRSCGRERRHVGVRGREAASAVVVAVPSPLEGEGYSVAQRRRMGEGSVPVARTPHPFEFAAGCFPHC